MVDNYPQYFKIQDNEISAYAHVEGDRLVSNNVGENAIGCYWTKLMKVHNDNNELKEYVKPSDYVILESSISYKFEDNLI